MVLNCCLNRWNFSICVKELFIIKNGNKLRQEKKNRPLMVVKQEHHFTLI